jgi:hypothetical protein
MTLKHRIFAFTASAVCVFAVASRAEGSSNWWDGKTFGEISARLGVQMKDSSRSRFWQPSGDVNGQVGYPLTIAAPSFDCPSGWTASTTVDSGTLPPGMAMDEHGNITGTPTERGHWPVVLKLNNIMCDGHHYEFNGAPDVFVDFGLQHGFQTGDPSQCSEGSVGYCNLTTIRFHITGTGEVH